MRSAESSLFWLPLEKVSIGIASLRGMEFGMVQRSHVLLLIGEAKRVEPQRKDTEKPFAQMRLSLSEFWELPINQVIKLDLRRSPLRPRLAGVFVSGIKLFLRANRPGLKVQLVILVA